MGLRILPTAALVLLAMAVDQTMSAGQYICHGNVDKYDCPRGWTRNYNMCYKNFKTAMNWESADKFCAKKGGYLVSIHGARENSIIYRLAKANGGSTWIGGRALDTKYRFYWQDYSQFCYTNWHKGQPSRGHPQLCVTINWQRKPTWDNDGCNRKRPFVCEIDLNDNPEKNEYYSGNFTPYKQKQVRKCQKGYSGMMGNRCYMAVSKKMTWDKASQYCGEKDGWMVSVNNDLQTQILEDIWTKDFKKANEMWVGMFKTGNGPWEYGDKSIIHTIRWGKGYPEKGYNNCVAMGSKGRLYNRNCNSKTEMKPFICYSKVIQYMA